MRSLVTGCVLLAAPGVATAAAVTGTVFVDVDGNGVWSTGDTPVAGAAVWLGSGTRVTTDAGGGYSLFVGGAGVLWVRTPDGLAPYPAWTAVTTAGGEVDFALARNPVTGPPRFVQGSDTHIGAVSGDAAARALAQAGGVLPRPHFLTITGDLTQGNTDGEFEALARGLAQLDVPFVAVPGNHDYYDGGANYRKYLGPTTYSFDAGGTHFVVLESTDPGTMLPFLDQDLADVVPGTPIAAFLHYPPAGQGDAAFVNGLRSRGVNRLFTGHLHRGRTFDYDGVVDYNMSPMVMGGVDFTPGGYRVVTLDGAGAAMTYYTTVEAPVFRLLHPLPGACVSDGPLELIAAVEAGGAPVTVTARVDGGAAVPLAAAGGWAHTGTVTVTEGQHTVELLSDRPEMATVTVSFCGERREAPAVGADWPQLQGGPRHLGATAVPVSAPLQVVWARAVGGHLRGGSPVLAAGKLYVPVVDPAGGERGGVVALDARTGEVRWEARLGRSVHNAPAVAGDLVVVSAEDGVVHGLAADSGAERWAVDLSATAPKIASSLFASPTVVDGIVYVGVVGNFAAIDATTGAVMWRVDPAPAGHVDATYSSVAIEDRVVVGLFGYGAAVGLSAFDLASGSSLWKMPGDLSVASAVSPIIVDGRVYGGNGASEIYAADLRTGEVMWQVQLDDSGGPWSYLLGATPAIAGGRIFVPTHADHLFALAQSDGSTLWTVEAQEGVLHPVHYRSATRSFASSPVATGNILWVGAADGWLRAVDVENGDVLWSVDLGAPILSGVVPASPWLYAASWDGTVRGMVTRGMLPPRPPPDEGCAVGGAGTASLLVLAAVFWMRRRK